MTAVGQSVASGTRSDNNWSFNQLRSHLNTSCATPIDTSVTLDAAHVQVGRSENDTFKSLVHVPSCSSCPMSVGLTNLATPE
ncbi:unnamed protein product [Lota lota]